LPSFALVVFSGVSFVFMGVMINALSDFVTVIAVSVL
jgi:hypothetical protein